MKIGDKVVTVTCGTVQSYNCAMATINGLTVKAAGVYCYDKIENVKDEHLPGLALEFMEWLKHPPGATGVFKERIAFFVFHDNIKSEGEHPLFDMSSWLHWIMDHQAELRCHVTRTPLADNLWHQPPCSHLGSVYVLIPPYITTVKAGQKLSPAQKEGIASTLAYCHKLHKDDEKLLKKLVA